MTSAADYISISGYCGPGTAKEALTKAAISPRKVLMTAVKEALLKQGHSLASWSRERGYDERAVMKYLHRYAARPQLPRSPEVYAILNDLRKDTGINLMKKVS